MQRIAIGRLWTENHSFSPLLINRTMFECGLWAEKEAIPAKLRGARSEVGGFLNVLDQADVEVVPLIAAQSMCGGPIEQPVWAEIRDKMLAYLADAGTVDGVLLSLHGAMVAENEDDCAGALLAAVRRQVGPDVPIIATLDMHANPTDQMVAAATALIAYKTYPHHDFVERGEQAARLLLRTLAGEVKPTMAAVSIPLMLNLAVDIQLDRIAEGVALEEADAVLACSVLSTHQYLDVPNIKYLTAIVVADGDREKARQIGQQLMWQAWQEREKVKAQRGHQGLPLAAAVETALAMPPGTVLLADLG